MPQSAAEELLDVIEFGYSGYVFNGEQFIGDGCITENQAAGLLVAEKLHFAKAGFKFRAMVERWSMEELVERLREQECTTYAE